MKVVSIVSQMEYIPSQLERLNALGEFVQYSESKATSENIIQLLGDADALIVGASGVQRLDEEIFKNCKNLKFVSALSSGTDFIDKEAAKKYGVKISNAKGANAQSVSEHIWGMIFNLSKKITESHIGTKKGKYSFDDYEGIELFGKTIGLIGTGEIGKRVAKVAKSLNMKILGYNKSKKSVENIEIVELHKLLKVSDVIVVAIPSNNETEKFIKKEEINLIKNKTILVSISRENIIDQNEVLKAIENGKLFGYGLELDIKNKPDDRFYNYPNILVTPHTAFFTTESELKVNETAVDNVIKFAEGKFQNIVV